MAESTHQANRPRVLLVGAGGLGCAVLWALSSESLEVTIVDDDTVEVSNLQRQVLFSDADIGAPKAEIASRWANAETRLQATAIQGRFLPSTALNLASSHEVIIDGSDNFATKFLVADAAHLSGAAAISAGVVRWSGWALGTGEDAACMRCVFEETPGGDQETCASAGVVGPAVGVVGATQALLALRRMTGLFVYDGLRGRLRRSRPRRRPGCPLCEGAITDINEERYLSAGCAA